jgi:hypothetical protein
MTSTPCLGSGESTCSTNPAILHSKRLDTEVHNGLLRIVIYGVHTEYSVRVHVTLKHARHAVAYEAEMWQCAAAGQPSGAYQVHTLPYRIWPIATPNNDFFREEKKGVDSFCIYVSTIKVTIFRTKYGGLSVASSRSQLCLLCLLVTKRRQVTSRIHRLTLGPGTRCIRGHDCDWLPRCWCSGPSWCTVQPKQKTRQDRSPQACTPRSSLPKSAELQVCSPKAAISPPSHLHTTPNSFLPKT